MAFLALDGCDLYYELHGSGPPLVFAHGLGGGHLTWWQQVPRFQDRYTCVTFAHRGFGRSKMRDGDPDPAAFDDDLTALIDHLGFEDVRLVAQSMGGWACLEYAIRRPERVRALVMACTVGTMTHPESERLIAENAAAHPRSARYDGAHPACGERMLREQPALHFLYTQVAGLTDPPPPVDFRDRLAALRTRPAEAVAKLEMPVLCIAGDEDVVMPPGAVRVLASLIPGARYVTVPEAGHSVYWERAETFNRLVGDFLAEVDGR
jgi:3-oxoadipate enol-lactonase